MNGLIKKYKKRLKGQYIKANDWIEKVSITAVFCLNVALDQAKEEKHKQKERKGQK
ncbi:unnamed protein product [Meloidogyne enterolobii]|uniref:Uncharacterized protein n=1 Tax=Meloidogyne enterolobii TaxID=390850 RepID=A0ACB0ZQG7_MELEN